MRRAIIALIVAALAFAIVPGVALGEDSDSVSLDLHKQWVQWAFGGSEAPLLQENFCGEEVGGVFFLTVAGGAPTSVNRTIDCEIPAGVPILVTPGGAISWAPTDGKTDNKLHRALFGQLLDLLVQSVRVVLDGQAIDHGPLVVPDPYDLELDPGNLIQTVDPAVTGDSTRIAEGWYFTLIGPLTPGDHVLIASDKYDFTDTGGEVVRYRTRFEIHVS